MSDTFDIPDVAPAPEPVSIDPAAPADPAAPFGRFANGKPRKAPPPQRKAKATAPAPKAGPPRAPKKGAPTDYRPVVEKGFGMLSMAFVALSKGGRNRPFLADAATLQLHAKEGARVINDMAQINPGLAKALASSAPAVPYLELGTFLFGLGAQLAANHGVRLPLPGGAVEDPEQLAAGMEQQLRNVAAAQAAQDERDRQEAEEIRRLVKDGRVTAAPADHDVVEHGFAVA